MFAHKVMEDCEYGAVSGFAMGEMPDSAKEFYTRLSQAMCGYIPSSHTFYFKEAYDVAKIDSIHNIDLDVSEYFYDNAAWVRPPYNNISFAWDTFKIERSRIFATLITKGNIISAATVEYSFKVGRFILHPSLIKFDIKNKEAWCTGHYKNNDDKQAMAGRLASFAIIIIATLKLLNCKNIVSEAVKPGARLNKKRIKNGRLPVYEYKVLKVALPASKGGGVSGNEESTRTRIHLCRGHFKEYTKEKPLFGKLTGLYWWQPHVRGDKKKGVVMKDYVVETTKGNHENISARA